MNIKQVILIALIIFNLAMLIIFNLPEQQINHIVIVNKTLPMLR